MLYLNLKALHIIGVVVWFAGLFYLGRLFVYHKEAEDRPEAERRVLLEQFEIMERRLYYAITWPGLCITVGFGLSVIGPWLTSGWMHAKLTFVVLLIAYHLGCGALRKQLAVGSCRWTSRHFRLFNEVPSLILLAIVFLVVLKDAVSWPALLGILAGTVVLIGITVQTVMRRQRARKAQEPDRP
jgi:putative membrane protein